MKKRLVGDGRMCGGSSPNGGEEALCRRQRNLHFGANWIL